MTLQLQIELLSDTAPGSGEGSAGGIDRDVVYTKNGLPYLPAKRLKGCLREAAIETSEALALAKISDLWPPNALEQLFGTTGQAHSGWLHLDNGYLEGADALEKWLEWAGSQHREAFGPEATLTTYTGTRAQTSISRTTGAPVPNTLRSSRVIKQGCKFLAKAELIPPPGENSRTNELLLPVFGLACAAFRRLGLSRNRGLGEVRVALLDDINHTEMALAKLAQRVGKGN